MSRCGEATTIATDTAHIVINSTLDQLPTLFNLTDEFADTMQLNILAAFVPGMVGIVGTLLFGWGMTLCAYYARQYPAWHLQRPQTVVR